jgi:MFS family permease
MGRIKKELSEIYLNMVVQTFALSLIGIFIPIYLLKMGFELNMVFIFMILHWGILAFASPLSARLSSWIGLKHTILLRMPVLMIYMFLLMYIGSMDFFVFFLIAILGGLSACLYWIPLNSEFVKNTNKQHVGEEVGFLMAFPRIAAIFAPFIGGAILEVMGFNPLFVLVLVLIAISVVPLFRSADYKSPFKFRLKDTKITIGRNFSFVHLIYGMIHMSEVLMWPLFIFLTLGDILIVGAAASITAIGIAFFIVLVGRASDAMDKRKLLVLGAIGYGIVWFARMFSMSPIDILLLSFMGGLFDSLIHVSLFSQFCVEARDRNILAHVSSRELWLGIGRVLPLILILVFAVQSMFFIVFMATGLVCLGLMLFKSDYDIRQEKVFSVQKRLKRKRSVRPV